MPDADRPRRVVASVQSCYVPWKGYFDLIAAADEFVLYDDVQYTKKDWRNRNRIKTPNGLQWLTIPVETSGRFEQRIQDVRVGHPAWARKHWRTIRASLGRAPGFAVHGAALEELYARCDDAFLGEVNRRFLSGICAMLGIATTLTLSGDYELTSDDLTGRVVEMCRKAGATTFLSGPRARDYYRVEAFAEEGIELRWVDYDGYPEYPQLHGAFEHHVSIVDLLLNTGADARRYMRDLRAGSAPAAGEGERTT